MKVDSVTSLTAVSEASSDGVLTVFSVLSFYFFPRFLFSGLFCCFLSVSFFADKYLIGKSISVGMPLGKDVSLETNPQGCPKNAGSENSSKCCSLIVYIIFSYMTCMKGVHSQFGIQ